MLFEDLSRQRRARTRQQQIAESIEYRQNLRQVNAEKKRMQALIDEYAAQAAEAERGGQHDRAVRLAQEAHRLKQYLASSGGISAALETAHAVTTANRALANILEASGGLADKAARMVDPAALGEAQANMLAVNENMRMMMEQSDLMLEDIGEDDDRPNEAAEAFLREIMRNVRNEKRSRVLQDTHRQLDRLQRARAAEK